MFMENFFQNYKIIALFVSIWVLPWKAYSLWIASQRRDKKWFLVLVLINTVAILEIIYIFFVAKKKPKDIFNSFINIFK